LVDTQASAWTPGQPLDRRRDDVYEAIYGCLIGGAIGDALGAPVENWHFTDIRARYDRIRDFLPQPPMRDGEPGQIADDSTLRHYLCQALST
jgi:ADP-ribosyl-[dinitrogen reductase] hydrolase